MRLMADAGTMTAFYTEPDEPNSKIPMTNSKLIKGFSNKDEETYDSHPLKLSIQRSNSNVSLINVGDKKPAKILSTIQKGAKMIKQQ